MDDVELVFGVDALDEVVSDGVVDLGVPPRVFVACVGGDYEEGVDAELSEYEGVTVEDAVLEVLV